MELGLLRLATLLYLAATLVALAGLAGAAGPRPRPPPPPPPAAALLSLARGRPLSPPRGGAFLPRLPSLEPLARLNYTCLVWGLILLTLGIVSGIMWAHEAWGRSWSTDPKLVFSLLTWAVYVVLLQGRMTAGWRGRWAATLTIAGFAVIVLSLVSVNVLALGNHGKAF